METFFMNTKNSKTSKSHKFRYNFKYLLHFEKY